MRQDNVKYVFSHFLSYGLHNHTEHFQKTHALQKKKNHISSIKEIKIFNTIILPKNSFKKRKAACSNGSNGSSWAQGS